MEEPPEQFPLQLQQFVERYEYWDAGDVTFPWKRPLKREPRDHP